MLEFLDFILQPTMAAELEIFCYDIFIDCIVEIKRELGIPIRDEMNKCWKAYGDCLMQYVPR